MGAPGSLVPAATRSLRNWSLHRRVGVMIALVLIVTVSVACWSSYDAWQARSTVVNDQQTLIPAQAGAEALLSGMVDQETGERGYLITANSIYLEPFNSGHRQVTQVYRQLEAELQGHADDLAELHSVDQRYTRWLDDIAVPQINDVRSGQRAAAIRSEDSGRGKHYFDSLRASLSALSSSIEEQNRNVNTQVDQALTSVFATAIARAGVIFILLALALLLLRRWVNDPVERLASEARVVAAGDLDHPIEPSGPPELRALGRDVEEMRRRLRDEDDELRRLRQALAEHSPLHLLLQSELESSTAPVSISIAGRLLPAEGVLAGDWYDAWDLGGDRAAVALVDIAGHGPAAGFFALKVKHLLSPALHAGMSPGEALSWTAQECEGNDEQFATGILVYLDLADGGCRYANAGHPPGLLFRQSQSQNHGQSHGQSQAPTQVEELGTTGPLLCGFPGSWTTRQVQLADGDLLVLTTDGVLEARLPDGSEFGKDRLVEAVRRHGRSASPEDVAESIVSAVREARGAPLKDDATVIVIRSEVGR